MILGRLLTNLLLICPTMTSTVQCNFVIAWAMMLLASQGIMWLLPWSNDLWQAAFLFSFCDHTLLHQIHWIYSLSICHVFWSFRASDVFFGHMKLFLLLLNTTCILSTFWFLLIAQKYVEYSRGRCFDESNVYLDPCCFEWSVPVLSAYSFTNRFNEFVWKLVVHLSSRTIG